MPHTRMYSFMRRAWPSPQLESRNAPHARALLQMFIDHAGGQWCHACMEQAIVSVRGAYGAACPSRAETPRRARCAGLCL